MSQFTEVPSYISQILNQNLKGLTLPCNSTLIQYVDNLLLCSKDEVSSKADSSTAYCSETAEGLHRKADNLSKEVHYPRQKISHGEQSLTPENQLCKGFVAHI